MDSSLGNKTYGQLTPPVRTNPGAFTPDELSNLYSWPGTSKPITLLKFRGFISINKHMHTMYTHPNKTLQTHYSTIQRVQLTHTHMHACKHVHIHAKYKHPILIMQIHNSTIQKVQFTNKRAHTRTHTKTQHSTPNSISATPLPQNRWTTDPTRQNQFLSNPKSFTPNKLSNTHTYKY